MRNLFAEKVLNKKTIVKVRGGGFDGVWLKTILSRFLILGPFPNFTSLMYPPIFVQEISCPAYSKCKKLGGAAVALCPTSFRFIGEKQCGGVGGGLVDIQIKPTEPNRIIKICDFYSRLLLKENLIVCVFLLL